MSESNSSDPLKDGLKEMADAIIEGAQFLRDCRKKLDGGTTASPAYAHEIRTRITNLDLQARFLLEALASLDSAFAVHEQGN